MEFSIITPSFRGSQWLKLCIASVADQEGVAHEHIVQDACSDDGTLDWLPHDPRVTAYVEKDGGMYDAVNRGLRRARGEILAYINCDEQYLPGALRTVYDFFVQHPAVDVVFADMVVIDTAGNYICHRKAMVPLASHLWLRFPAYTCSMFFRRRALEQHGLCFDTRWRDIADLFWAMTLVEKRVTISVMRQFTSAFTVTGDNMNLKANAEREDRMKREMTPPWIRTLRPAIVLHHYLRSLAQGLYFQRPFTYSIYTQSRPEHRTVFNVPHPTSRWRHQRTEDVKKAAAQAMATKPS
ncbi:MAG TPA: glycosyltransferase family 2 protein [Verrucomicrobiae bacterium]|nr:glycosyltransferase family 2 protein [Verrucomicrobiae bacterium]